jgi:hypothetical protein
MGGRNDGSKGAKDVIQGLSGSTFESYNARHLGLREIAATFVSSEFFETLSARRHTLILGPRGSGKTTLLKMLLQPALEYWDGPDAERFRRQITFTSLFVPTDITWASQLVSLNERLKNQETTRLFTTAIFSIHVCRAFATALRERIQGSETRPFSFRRASVSDQQEETIARHLIATWQIGDVFPSLASVHRALGSHLVAIDRIATREAFLGESGRGDRLAGERLLQIQFPVALQPAIDIANDVLGEPDGKWSVLFDELELAPVWIQDRVLPLLRSTDERMLFKVALSPFVFTAALRDITSPAASQDYDPVQLWFGDKDDARLAGFCRKIWAGAFASRGLAPADADWALGRSRFDLGRDSWVKEKTAYHPKSAMADEFRSLAEKDRSFSRYIRDRRLVPDQWPELDGVQRAKSIRKIQHVVIARNYFRGLGRQRSRKSKDLYCGAASLFAVSEGNPRILKAVTSRLIDLWKDREHPIPRPTQSEAMTEAGERFEALLATVPVPEPHTGAVTSYVSLVELLGDVANYLHKVAILDDFQDEPPGSFIVDRWLGSSVLDVLRSGINMGALIIVPGGRELVQGELIGARLRLSYLIAMKRNSLIRLGRAINLSAMVPKLRRAMGTRDVRQLDLIDEPAEVDDAED